MSLLRAFALSLPAVLLAACGSKQPPADDVRVVRTTTVTADDGSSRSEYSGEVRARYESSVGFRVAGRISQRLVEVGTRVRRNQPLAKLDAVDAELNVGSARAQLASVRSEYAQIELDFQRAQRLFERRFISQAEFDRDRVQMESARAKLTAAEAEFALASNQHSYTVLLAPQDGVVTELRAEAGEVVQAGQAIATIAADGEREVVVGVPESRLEEIRAARELQVELWARPGKLYAGRVRELAPMTDSATRQYTARVAIVDADSGIELGMTAHVRLAGQRSARCLSTAADCALPEGRQVVRLGRRAGLRSCTRARSRSPTSRRTQSSSRTASQPARPSSPPACISCSKASTCGARRRAPPGRFESCADRICPNGRCATSS